MITRTWGSSKIFDASLSDLLCFGTLGAGYLLYFGPNLGETCRTYRRDLPIAKLSVEAKLCRKREAAKTSDPNIMSLSERSDSCLNHLGSGGDLVKPKASNTLMTEPNHQQLEVYCWVTTFLYDPSNTYAAHVSINPSYAFLTQPLS